MGGQGEGLELEDSESVGDYETGENFARVHHKAAKFTWERQDITLTEAFYAPLE